MMNATLRSNLLERLRYFLTTSRRSRGSVQNFLDQCSDLSSPIIFGGMLRDMVIKGNWNFSSDVDVVLYDCDRFKFEKLLLMTYPNYEINAFGGYKLKLDGWDVDVWLFENTWAFKKGLLEGSRQQDLIKTTFFNWDAVAYSVKENLLFHSETYFQDIQNKFLDINFETNPNKIGIYRRIERFLLTDRASLSPKLCNYFSTNISEIYPLRESKDTNDVRLFNSILNLNLQIEKHLTLSPLAPFSIQASIFEHLTKDSNFNL